MIERADLPLVLALAITIQAQPDPTHKHLLLVLDGLRPDYITKDMMPNLHALAQHDITFTNHHAIYPTITRINASSISTKAYPERHGILGNSMFFPRVDTNHFLDTGQHADLERIQHDQDKILLTAATLSETLRANGKKILAVSASTNNAIFLLNHTVADNTILHTDYTLPAPLHQRILAELGPPPPAGHPNDARNHRAVNAFLKIGLPSIDPAMTAIWLSDPNTTAHALKIEHPTTIETLRQLDREVLNIQKGLRKTKLFDVYNIQITSDHNFATHTDAPDMQTMLKPFASTLADSSPRIAYDETTIYVRDGNRQIMHQIVRTLQSTTGIKTIFTQPDRRGSLLNSIEETLSFEIARSSHARTGDILYSPDWTDTANDHNITNTNASNDIAGHNSSSPFEIHNTLIATGPDIKQEATINVPNKNIDFAPTFLHMLGFPIPSSIQGRPLIETLRVPTASHSTPSMQKSQQTTTTPDGTYSQTAFFSIVRIGSNDYRYLDYTKITHAKN